MIKSISSAALTLILAVPFQGIMSASAAPCDSGKYDPRYPECRESVEKRRAEDKKPKPLEPPKYPVKTGFFQMADRDTGTQTPFYLSSQDGSILVLNFAIEGSPRVKDNRPSLSLKSNEIVSWKSGIVGKGSDSSSAISTAVIGALLFWPMMIAAPFMVKNYTITGFEVLYIDEFGKDQPLAFVTIESPTPAIALLKFSTGLDSGDTRGPDITKKLYETGLQNSLARLKTQKEKILVKNNKKPWCSYVDTSKKSDDLTVYEQSVSHVKVLYTKLGLGEYSDSKNQATGDQWDQYLSSNPGMATWAKTFPQQADALKSCS
jgi:hypothetical protein